MRKTPMPDLRKSAGAFDLPSIITGVVVVGILAAGVLAAIFGVIPFAQDRGAKQDLSSIRTAEGVAKAKDNRFMDHAGLLDTGYLQLSSTEKTKVMADEKGTCYVALARSGTGKIFYSTDVNTDPEPFGADTDPGCLPADKLAELIEEVGGIEDEAPTEDSTPSAPAAPPVVVAPVGAPANLGLTASSEVEAKATWDPVKKATGYKVEYRVNGDAWVTKNTTATTAQIKALPEDTVTVRVYALQGEDVSEPSTVSIRLPDSAFINPGFEYDFLGWTLSNTYNSGIYTSSKHSGSKSAFAYHGVSQVVTVPEDRPVLTFWAWNANAVTVQVGGITVPTVATAAGVENGFTQYSADLSAYAGKSVTVNLLTKGEALDDVAFEVPRAPSVPLSVTALSKSSMATVSWDQPTFSGGGIPVTAYTASAWANGEQVASVKVAGDQRSAVFTGLKADTSYIFKVRATNEAGTSPDSAAFGPVTLNTGVFANPGFENDLLGWTLSNTYNSGIYTSSKHSGSKSAFAYHGVSQVVTVPEDRPVLTFWTWNANAVTVQVGGITVPTVATAAGVENGFTQYSADLSAYAGKSVTVNLLTKGEALDDVAFR